jgi:hypothetical protein
MTRVTSQKTRQMVLVLDGNPLDTAELPEKLELFDENGDPIDFTAGFISVPIGGLTGQILGKHSDDDGDLQWFPVDEIGLRWKGDFDPADAYSKNDLAFFEGSTWRATDDMGAGTAPTPGASGVAYVATAPRQGGYGYSVPSGEEFSGPLPNETNGFGIGGFSNWIRIVGVPGSVVDVEMTQKSMAYDSTGAYTIFPGQGGSSPVTGDRTLNIPGDGILWFEVGSGGIPTAPWTMRITYDSGAGDPPTWQLVAQHGDPAPARVHGRVAADGTETGIGFTVTKNGTGDYTITFDVAFSEVPSIALTPRQVAGGTVGANIHETVDPTVNAVRIVTFNSTDGTALDAPFHFVAEP